MKLCFRDQKKTSSSSKTKSCKNNLLRALYCPQPTPHPDFWVAGNDNFSPWSLHFTPRLSVFVFGLIQAIHISLTSSIFMSVDVRVSGPSRRRPSDLILSLAWYKLICLRLYHFVLHQDWVCLGFWSNLHQLDPGPSNQDWSACLLS